MDAEFEIVGADIISMNMCHRMSIDRSNPIIPIAFVLLDDSYTSHLGNSKNVGLMELKS